MAPISPIALAPESRPKPAPQAPRAPHVQAPRTIWERLGPAVGAFAAALLVAVCDPIYAAVTGEVLRIAGVRPSVFAAVLLLAALGLGLRELLRGDPAA